MLKNLKPKAAEAKRLADERRREIEKLPWSQIESYANVLLAGYVEDLGDGRRVTKYIDDDPGGEVWTLKERDARIAMAILLRSGRPLTLTQDFRNRLAAWFDGGAGRRRDHVRNTAIAETIYNDLCKGHGVEEAIKKTMGLFGMEKKAIEKIWYGDKKLNNPGFRKSLEQIYGPLPKQKRGPKKNT